MTGRMLVDTNVLVYAHDRSEPAKRVQAADVLGALVDCDAGLLSTQVVSEFFWVATRRLSTPLGEAEAARQAELILRSWRVLEITPFVVLEALRGVREHALPYWDAQVWAAARMSQTGVVLSEDFQSGRVIDGVEFVDPFAPDFSLASYGLG